MNVHANIPADPDWAWLRAHSGEIPGLWMDHDYDDMVNRCRWSCIYLATPYSREVVDDGGHWQGVQSANLAARAARWSALLALRDITALSPIVLAHAMVTIGGTGAIDPLDQGLWRDWCQRILNSSRAIVVPGLAGCERSRGIWREITWGLQNGVSVYVLKDGGRAGAGGTT